MAISSGGMGRPRRGRIYIVVGAILAVLAFGTAAAVASLPLLAGTTGTKVVVARNTIPARTRILASDLELRSVSPTPPQSFTDIALVAGKGARVDIPAGLAVTANLISSTPDQLNSSDSTFLPIPSGYVAVTVPTSEQVGVAGYVQVGDRLVVLATISTAAFGSGPARPVVRTVFRDLIVIRVGPASTTEQSGSGQLTSSLTVLVTSCDAEFLFWLLNNAVLKYELESSSDYGTTPTAADAKCPTLTSAGGVGPKQVDDKWHFTTN
ncbi:MAG TPA: RcpC/CpaB family pilus assembly protein [Candidatus Dormibacteraeota bacterium]|jgi:pilus assembly protein CpaB